MTDKPTIHELEAILDGDAPDIEIRPDGSVIASKWHSVENKLPPPHTHIWCYNRDGRYFEGCVCYGMHEPFFTYPHGDGSLSNTCPNWIDVTYWRDLPPPPPKETS